MFARTNSRQSKILRLSNVIGVGADPKTVRWSTVPAEFCSQAVHTHQIIVRSSRLTQRDFIAIERVAESLSDTIETYQAWDGKVSLIASGKSTTIESVANLVSAVASEVMMVEIPVKFKVDLMSGQRKHQLRVVCDSPRPDKFTNSGGSEIFELQNSVSQLIRLAIQETGIR